MMTKRQKLVFTDHTFFFFFFFGTKNAGGSYFCCQRYNNQKFVENLVAQQQPEYMQSP